VVSELPEAELASTTFPLAAALLDSPGVSP